MLNEEEIEAGVLLILACAAGFSFKLRCEPGIKVPHAGCLPREEYLLRKKIQVEADGTMTLNGRPWLILE